MSALVIAQKCTSIFWWHIFWNVPDNEARDPNRRGSKAAAAHPGYEETQSCLVSGLLRRFCLDWSNEERAANTVIISPAHLPIPPDIKRFSLLSASLFTCRGNIYDADMKIKITKLQFFNMSTDWLLRVGRLRSTTSYVCKLPGCYFLWLICFFISCSCLLPTSIDTFRPKFWRSSSIWGWQDDNSNSSSSGGDLIAFLILPVSLSNSLLLVNKT